MARLYEIENFREKIVCFDGVAFRSKESNWWYVTTGCSANACVGSNFDKDGWTEYVEPKPKKKYTMYRHCYLFKGKLKCMYDDKPWQKDKEEKSGVTHVGSKIIEEFEV